MNQRIKMLVGLCFFAMACSSTTTTPNHVGDDDDDDDGSTSSHKDGGKTPGDDDDDDDDDASTTPDASAHDAASTPDASTAVDSAPKQLTCPLTFTGACGTCFASSCATQCGTCAEDTDCDAAMVCLSGCTTEACDTACLENVPQNSLALLNATIGSQGCLGTLCESDCVSATAEIGDPCTTAAQCVSNSCNGEWCEPAAGCTQNTQCGIDTEGELVWCVEGSGGTNGCFPGCSSNADCALYPGTSCKAVTATNGATADICSL